MKLMNADKVIDKINEMLVDVLKHPDITDAKDEFGNPIEFKLKTSVNRKREADGSFNIVLELRRNGVSDWKCIVVYFAEHSHGITTIVVNGLLHNIIFENSTMNSPDALLTYLPEIILSDVKYLKECKMKKAPRASKEKRNYKDNQKDFADRRKPRVSRNTKYKNNSVNKSGRPNKTSYNKNRKNFDSSYKKYYN